MVRRAQVHNWPSTITLYRVRTHKGHLYYSRMKIASHGHRTFHLHYWGSKGGWFQSLIPDSRPHQAERRGEWRGPGGWWGRKRGSCPGLRNRRVRVGRTAATASLPVTRQATTSHPAIATSHSAPASHSAAKTNANVQALTDFNKQYWAIKDEGGNGIDANLAILNDSQSATSPAVQTALGNFGVDSQAWAASADQASWHKALGDLPAIERQEAKYHVADVISGTVTH